MIRKLLPLLKMRNLTGYALPTKLVYTTGLNLWWL